MPPGDPRSVSLDEIIIKNMNIYGLWVRICMDSVTLELL